MLLSLPLEGGEKLKYHFFRKKYNLDKDKTQENPFDIVKNQEFKLIT